ncbi:hypothetical protein [Desulfurivibrio alkaliphilus]|uniref:Uncharacterized protein n=1 Tax=Desulfurivibrio alkaliphilus (strain DSM 19089 / UNIQEM U267 / AHT2) TaxID=589865 RepID=D6Z112_DESAT|nr:hypothetical protein [Desulfurivibrio alkaliphilus]ADH87272.1 hypothetical protein DaAHT2_2611 [Desulfurivibrio alkaliphilus AHT 2]
MPHFGLMDENLLGPVAGPLQRARLHIRSGRRRLNQGKIDAGIATLADAFCSAMKWYLAANRQQLAPHAKGETGDDQELYDLLVLSGVLDGSFDYQAFDLLVNQALEGRTPAELDPAELMLEIEKVMLQLGVMPFDESALPAEDPATY